VAKKSPQHANSPALVALGEAIRHYRSEAGLSQEALALEAEIDRSYLGGIERGEHNVAVMNLVKLASALGVTVSKLVQQARL
jgi:transcriptional regulator with XRE-family HTH domain